MVVVHPDADLVSIIDTGSRRLVAEIPLASTPMQDPVTERYEVAVMPRALVLDSLGQRAYVSGERSGHVYAIDLASARVVGDATACAEPVGILLDAADRNLFVACSNDDQIVEIDARSLAVVASVPVPRKPWALAWSGDTLLCTHFLGAAVSALSTETLALTATWPLPPGPASHDPTVPPAPVRGQYDLAPRPGTQEIWAPSLMLGTDTSQPTLDFLRTVFPAISVLDQNGTQLDRLSFAPSGQAGAFGDVVSGPHAITFSPDGKTALLIDTNSEDVLAIDADARVEATLLRPLSGHQPEGIVWARDGSIYVQERNTEDVLVLSALGSGVGLQLAIQGEPIPTLSFDPMPPAARLGQHLFFSSNSDEYPLTQDHWIACASCHLEGRSDAVTWRFAQGPRDTPSNAGGMLATGFLFRTADRNRVEDYWQTINKEQGGHFVPTNPSQTGLLDAIAYFVNYALPLPTPPATDDGTRARGQQLFGTLGCASCHSGAAFTDSGAGNATLDLSGAIRLHDVGTCVTSGYPDVAHEDEDGDPRAACAFDTPSLRGAWDSAPYLHDGSKATLDDVLEGPAAHVGNATTLSASDQAALVEYLKSL